MSMVWFKLNANFDHDDRIVFAEGHRNGGVAIYHYIKLNCIAARSNKNGGVFIADNIPHTAKTLARQWKCKEVTVNNSIDLLVSAGLVEIIDGVIVISDWCLIQSVDKLEEMRKNARLRKQKSRERQAAEKQSASRDKDVTATPRHAVDIDKEKEKDIEVEVEAEEEKTIDEIVECFNTTAFSKIKFLSAKQKEAVMNAINEFGKEQLKNCFTIASNSEFLKGKNNMGWTANFDWLIKPENIAKVLNGNYSEVFSADNVGIYADMGLCSSFDSEEFTQTALARGFDDIF